MESQILEYKLFTDLPESAGAGDQRYQLQIIGDLYILTYIPVYGGRKGNGVRYVVLCTMSLEEVERYVGEKENPPLPPLEEWEKVHSLALVYKKNWWELKENK